jgi:hypothetical protein
MFCGQNKSCLLHYGMTGVDCVMNKCIYFEVSNGITYTYSLLVVPEDSVLLLPMLTVGQNPKTLPLSSHHNLHL